jgi:glutaredoxin 3
MSVRIVSKPGCPYCVQAKAFCEEKGIAYVEDVLDPTIDTYPAARDALVEMTGQKTFPFIFVRDTFVGGYTDFVEAFDTLGLCPLVIDTDADF